MIITDLQAQIITLGTVMIITLLFAGMKTDWLLFKILRVQTNRSKNILVRKRLPTGNLYYIAKKDREKDILIHDKLWSTEGSRITLKAQAIHTEFGCKLIEIDADNRLYCPDGSIVRGFDARHIQDLFKREAEKPPENNNAENLKLFLAFLGILLSIIAIYFAFKNSQKLDLIIGNINILGQQFVNASTSNII